MTDVTIPRAALEAGAHAYRTVQPDRTHLHAIRAACLAMLEAWPGMQHDNYVIILPQQEASDE
jgi:hypothetical protein